jgi:hypothetical protein
MIQILKNERDHAIFQKEDVRETWFNHDCSDEMLLKQLGRTDKIKRIKFEDVNGIADRLNVYFD